jgi:hypothetical protein
MPANHLVEGSETRAEATIVNPPESKKTIEWQEFSEISCGSAVGSALGEGGGLRFGIVAHDHPS